MRLAVRFLLAALSGLLAAFLGATHGLAAWITGVPGLLAIRGTTVPVGFLCGFISGGVCAGIAAWGLQAYGWPLYLGSVAFLAVFVAAVGAATVGFGRRFESRGAWVLVPPIAWGAFSWGRNLLDLPVPSTIAASQIDFPAVLQIAALTGPAGISFLLILGNGILVQIIAFAWAGRQGRAVSVSQWIRLGLVSLLFLGIPLLAGAARLKETPPPAQGNRVAIVQGGFPIEHYRQASSDEVMRKLLRDRYVQLTHFAGGSNPLLIVWPEEPTLGDLLIRGQLNSTITKLANRHNVHLLIGSSTGFMGESGFESSDVGPRFNSALLVSPAGELLARYDKRRPTPFEPYSPGQQSGLIDSPLGVLGIMICEESLFPSMSRGLVQEGAEILVELSNDAGFGKGLVGLFHGREAVLMSVAYGRPYIRAGQSGPSYLIDAMGRLESESGLFDSAVLAGRVSPATDSTLYLRWGDWFHGVCLAGLMILMGLNFRRGSRVYNRADSDE